MADPSAPASPDHVPQQPAVQRRETKPAGAAQPVREIGGRKDGTDPTRYGDWEKNGRCIDF
jgi:hypothetical protein